ncbi:MAG TPA: hypothetical protein VF610_01480 [Segetibacter sp.]|jgi:hypothetical protein
MFISSSYLSKNYGVDEQIARFFVDREPPENNLYWEGKLLYVRPAPGYLFIPLIVDLLFKLGIEKKQLLSEEFVGNMEQIGHISALEETKQIDKDEAIRLCYNLVKDNCRNEVWLQNVNEYFSKTAENFITSSVTPFTALHRGDAFLFSVCALTLPHEIMEKVVEQWFALITTVLLLDDAEDIKSDRENGEENAFLQSGLHQEGIANIMNVLKKSLQTIDTLNPFMAKELDDQFKNLLKKPHIVQVLNQI